MTNRIIYRDDETIVFAVSAPQTVWAQLAQDVRHRPQHRAVVRRTAPEVKPKSVKAIVSRGHRCLVERGIWQHEPQDLTTAAA